MKAQQCGSPKSNKLTKRISLADPSQTKSRETPKNQNEEYLSPMHIKLAKEKARPKKQQKKDKQQSSLDDKRTKRKQPKKLSMELNSTIVINDFGEKKNTKRELENCVKAKAKTADTILRQTLKSEVKKIAKNEWFIDLEQKSTVADLTQKKKKKVQLIKEDTPLPSNQEYLFIGDKFFLVNNLNPTKKLLNTFRQDCKKDQPKDIKFITQDRKDRLKRMPLEKKTNIFTEFRKQVELDNKVKKATKIQRWWRKCLAKRNFKKDNPEDVQDQNQLLNNSQSKVSFNESEQHQRKSPFEIMQFNSSPIKTKIQSCEDSIIASFNSAEKLGEEGRSKKIDKDGKPKKILFAEEDFSKLLVPTYKLPEIEVNSDENQAIFRSYAHFKIQEANNLDISSDLSLVSPQKQGLSPQKHEDQDRFYQRMPDQVSPNKVNDPRIQLLKEFQEATKVKEEIQLRIGIQKGMIKPIDTFNSKVGINTSILSLHTFLVKFFNFYIRNYQEQFISLINMPYGHSIRSRLKQLQGYELPKEVEEDDQGVVFGVQQIIDYQKLQQFYDMKLKQMRNVTNFSKANLQLQKIYNGAVIDLLNELLNQYRPYKQINGVPYPWNHSYKALTFYFVTLDNIAEVFQKVQIKILKDASLLSGIILAQDQKHDNLLINDEFEVNQFMQNYQKRFHPLVFQHNQDKELKCAQEAIKSEAFECNNEALTKIFIQISNDIFNELVLENAEELAYIKECYFN